MAKEKKKKESAEQKKRQEQKLKDKIDKAVKFHEKKESTYATNEADYQGKFYKEYSREARSLIDLNKKYKWMIRASANHTYTFIRSLHSQILANPPLVSVSSRTSDQKDKDAAIAADNVAIHERDRLELELFSSKQVLDCLLYGTGIMKIFWDAEDGDFFDHEDAESGEISRIFDGNVKLQNISCRNFFFDAMATSWKEVIWCLEKKFIELEEAHRLFPEHKKMIKEETDLKRYCEEDMVHEKVAGMTIIWELWEKAHPSNNMKGRYVVLNNDGKILIDKENPYKHKKLPYALFTDIDLPNTLWGKSVIELLHEPQKSINKLLSQILENTNLHSVIRMYLPDGAGIPEDSITDQPTDIIRGGSGQGKPEQLQPASLPSHVFKVYDTLVGIMEHIAGMRGYSRGQMQKTVSGFAAQLMIEQDQKVHLQLHNKYKMNIEEIYLQILSLCKQYWKEERSLAILGEDKEYEYLKYKNTDIDGKYNVKVQYGTSLPNDPVARRQAIMELFDKGLFEEKGKDFVLRLLELGDIAGAFDATKEARKRQKEEIEMLKRDKTPFNIREFEDHESHLEELYSYFQTKEFEYLDEEIKRLIEDHAKMHEQFVSQAKSGQLPAGEEGELPPPPPGEEPLIPPTPNGLPE